MKKYLPDVKKTPVIKKIPCASPAEDIFASFIEEPNTSLLNSSLPTDAGRYSFIGIEPFLSTKAKKNKLCFKTRETCYVIDHDPFEFLKIIFGKYKLDNPTQLPFTSGGVGYFSYDVKNILEKLPQSAEDTLRMPDMNFIFYQAILIRDNQDPDNLYISAVEIDSMLYKAAANLIEDIKNTIEQKTKKSFSFKEQNACPAFTGNFTKENYIQAVKKVLEYIRSGDIYQTCLSQRFNTKWSSCPYSLYKKLNNINPAPFSAYLNFENFKIISSSPELFLRLSDNTLETRPMKGTRPRGKTKAEDTILLNDLQNSTKDTSELSMIVDLERNDLGKVSIPGTVEVTEHKRIETYPTVFQSISVVKSKVKKDTSPIDIIRAASPGGSISGCPKIRAMEIIDELEPTSRGVYTGSIGYISFHDTMDLNIAIRTMVMKGENVYFQVGGGIVADSDPEKEYEETLHKARAMMEALGSQL